MQPTLTRQVVSPGGAVLSLGGVLEALQLIERRNHLLHFLHKGNFQDHEKELVVRQK